ncbi:MAG: ABC transporter substrate-binding protein, partial [Eubacteriales bacterium]|nr:ABC transporter substrate-binding protein [Eubacteriales bacterium]
MKLFQPKLKTRSRSVALILILAISLTALTGCGYFVKPQAVNDSIVVTDQLGRTINIQNPPQRIISSYYISTSLLIALGLEDRLVGIEDKPSKRPIYELSAPQLLTLPTVGTAKDFNLEAALALKPDLVILPTRLKDTIQTLDGLGIPVLGINPENTQLLNETIQLIGQATGTSARATQLIDYSARVHNQVSKLTTGKSQQVIYLAGNSDLLLTAGAKMYQSSLITGAGAINAAAELTDTYWTNISYEQLLAWQPDSIVLASDATYTTESVMQNQALAGLMAIQNQQVFQMPNSLEAWDS